MANDWQDWDPKTVEKGMDKLEKTVRGYGGGAAQVKRKKQEDRHFDHNFSIVAHVPPRDARRLVQPLSITAHI